jgi:hypothetical protein
MISPATRIPQPLARLALLAALVLAGCGGTATHRSGSANSSTHSTPQHVGSVHELSASQRAAYCSHGQNSCVTQSTALKAVGSPFIDLNLEQAMALNQPQVKHPKVTCPSSTRYPVHCTLTGSERLNGKRIPITGTITVIGISTINQTYAYEVLYRPGHSG